MSDALQRLKELEAAAAREMPEPLQHRLERLVSVEWFEPWEAEWLVSYYRDNPAEALGIIARAETLAPLGV